MLAFSELVSAVKPKDRTDQYLVLGALYCADAHRAPVTTEQVRAVMTPHRAVKQPSNLSARLTGYTGLVDPVSKGPPRTWQLTHKGLDRLRTLSGLALSVDSNADAYLSDVGIVCALEHPEMAAIIRAFGGPAAWTLVGDGRLSHVYRETTLSTTKGSVLRVVGTTATSMGLTAAAIAATQLVLQYRPRLVIMPGIAAGTRSGAKEFGDVLVADPSVDYNSGKVVEKDGIRDFLPDPYPIGIHTRIRTVLQKYRVPHPLLAQIRRDWSGLVPASVNRLHIGPQGTADQVIDDPNRIIEITKNWRKLIGVEMEAYGIYRACIEAPEPKPRFVSFKAVCDFAAEKTDSWQPYAAYVAGQFTSAFLRAEWESLWPPVSGEKQT